MSLCRRNSLLKTTPLYQPLNVVRNGPRLGHYHVTGSGEPQPWQTVLPPQQSGPSEEAVVLDVEVFIPCQRNGLAVRVFVRLSVEDVQLRRRRCSGGVVGGVVTVETERDN